MSAYPRGRRARRWQKKLRVTVERQPWPYGSNLTTSFGVAAHLNKEEFGDTIKRADAALTR